VNKGTHVVPLLQNDKPLAGQDSLYASATIDKNTNELIVKIVNASAKTQTKVIQVTGIKSLNANATMTVLRADKLDDVNSFNEPTKVIPNDQKLQLKGKQISLALKPYSFTVVRVKMS